MAKAEYRSAIRSRKLIKEALADLLMEKPLDKITVTDVVNRAQINRGTFYAHYADIPDVIHHLIQNTFADIRQALSEQPNFPRNIPHTLLQRIQTILEADLAFYRKIMNSSASAMMQEQLVQVMLDYLLQREKELAGVNHEQYVLMIRFCAGGLSNLYHDWFAGKLPFSLDELTVRAEALLNSIMDSSGFPENR